MKNLRTRAGWGRLVIVSGLVSVAAFALAAFAGAAPARVSEMPTPREAPTITGTPKEGQTLTANNGQWLYADGLGCGSECTYSYLWQRCDAAGANCALVPNATSRTYLLTSADVGNRLVVVNVLTKHDCDMRGIECRDVSSSQNSAVTDVIAGIVVAPPPPPPIPAPAVGSVPAITGNPMEEDTLTASVPAFTGQGPINISYQWLRCNAIGESCVAIASATGTTYTLTTVDVGSTIRIVATGSNGGGATPASSGPTAVIKAFGPTADRPTLTIDRVSLPHRLIIDKFVMRPATLRTLAPFTVRFRISDDRGFHIVGAVVSVTGVPAGLIQRTSAIESDTTGWATFTLYPTARLTFTRGSSLYLYIHVIKPGENPLAGVSNSRLVRVKLATTAK